MIVAVGSFFADRNLVADSNFVFAVDISWFAKMVQSTLDLKERLKNLIPALSKLQKSC